MAYPARDPRQGGEDFSSRNKGAMTFCGKDLKPGLLYGHLIYLRRLEEVNR